MLELDMQYLGEVTRSGFVFLEGFRPFDRTSYVMDLLGHVVTLPGGNPVHRLTPQKSAPPNTYSGIFGLETFPLHTDLAHWHLPPRFLVLRCVQGFDAVTTSILDGQQIVNEIGAGVLIKALVRPRRPVNGKFSILRLYREEKGLSALLRWDEKFIQPASIAGEVGIKKIKGFLARAESSSFQLSTPGDTLIVDNWRMLHGRSAVPERCASRVIERAYLGDLK